MKKHFFLFLVMFLILPYALLAQQLEIHHIDVGQADATLIKSPTGVTMLIDAGNTGNGTNIVIPYLASLGITSVNYVVCSHYHADHLGGLDELINGLGAANIGAVYDRGNDAPLPTTVAYNDYVAAANSTGHRYAVALGQILDLGGGVTMKCVASAGKVLNYGTVPNSGSSENDMSVGWVLNYNSFQYFTGGDLGGETTYYADNETPLSPQVGDVDACKIDHHGSQYSTNQTFVNTLKPEVSFIEVGNGNTYGHPTQAAINRLVAANSYIYQTELGSGGTIPSGKGVVASGTIVLKTSGTSYTVTYGTHTDTYPGDGGVTPPDTIPPVISGVTVASITSTGAQVTWTTDENSSSVVEYGLTTSYGSSTTGTGGVTSHSVTLGGLTTNTLYHYRVVSTDAAGNSTASIDHSFQTGGSFSYTPTGTVITYGSLKSGTYANLATNNASYYVLNSTTSSTRKCDWYGNVSISQPGSAVSKLIVTYDGKYSRSRTQILYLYNWTTSAWVQINSRSVSTSDVTVTSTQLTPAAYISGTGEIRLRVYTSGGNSNYTCSADYMQFTVETSGSSLTKPGVVGELNPAEYRLSQNYPNPFNPTTTIPFDLRMDGYVTIKVYNMLGEEVTTLVQEHRTAGHGTVEFTAPNLPSGVYLYRITSRNFVDTKRMMLLK